MKTLPPLVETHPQRQQLQWIINPLRLLEQSAARYGDCFTLELGRRIQLHVFSHPQAIEQIFTANPQQFEVGRNNRIVLQAMLGDNSLLLLDGERHTRERQLLMPPFHGERMRTYGELICQTTEQVTSAWKSGASFAVRPFVQNISLQIILKAVFGLEEGPQYREIQQCLLQWLQLSTSRFGFAMALIPVLGTDLGRWSPGGRFGRLRQQINQLLYEEIFARQAHLDPERTDILNLLLTARDEAGQPMTAIQLRDELVTLLVAGHETTATALTWALYWIHRSPQVKEKLLAELATLDAAFNSAEVVRLPYLNAVCAEVLRIYPIAFIAQIRSTKTAMQIGEYEIGAGAHLAPAIYLCHHRPDLYPEPDRFNPDRFLERQFSPYEYFPFGGSNRRCIGAAFALFEMKIVLATILSQHRLTLVNQAPVVPVRRGVTIAPKGEIYFLRQ